jgi:hypothetical protein
MSGSLKKSGQSNLWEDETIRASTEPVKIRFKCMLWPYTVPCWWDCCFTQECCLLHFVFKELDSFHELLSSQASSQFMLLGCMSICVTSLMGLDFVARIMVLLSKILWARSLLCFAHADFSGLCGRIWLRFSTWVRRHYRFDQCTLCHTRRVCCVCLDIWGLSLVWWVVAVRRFSVVVWGCVVIAPCWCGWRCVDEQQVGCCRVAVPL